MSEYITVPEERAGLELDEFLTLQYPWLNKGFLRREVRNGKVLVDGEPARPSQRLRTYQVVVVDVDEDEAPETPVAAPQVELAVLYEDDDVLALDKPAGVATEPERWARECGSLMGSLLEHVAGRARAEGDGRPADRSDDAPEPGGEGEPWPFRPRLLHRLDKGTSGVVLAAKHLAAERSLRAAFDERRVRKEYLALVEGEHPLGDGEHEELELALAPDPRRSGRMVVAADGKPSRTRVAVERRFRGYTLLRCEPLTGRTHQIRVHLAAAGFPLVVDELYGRRNDLRLSEFKPGYRRKPGRPERPLIDRLTLHARAIDFPQPADGRRVRVEAPLPADFERVLKQLGKVRPARS